MKIGFAGRMCERPIAQAVLLVFDDGGQREPQGGSISQSRQRIEIDDGLEAYTVRLAAH